LNKMDKEKDTKVGKNQIISGRCEILTEIINSLKDIYIKGNENQKAFIETIIGVAIWYIPKPKNFWTGYISIEAIKSFLDKTNKKPTLSEEHNIPRKSATEKLLMAKGELTAEYVEKQYLSKFCKLHYVTSEKNKRAIKFQKTGVYKNSKKVYKETNIELIKINTEQLKQIKQRNEKIIIELLNKYGINKLQENR